MRKIYNESVYLVIEVTEEEFNKIPLDKTTSGCTDDTKFLLGNGEEHDLLAELLNIDTSLLSNQDYYKVIKIPKRVCGYRRAQGQVEFDGETPIPQDHFRDDDTCSYCGGLNPEVLLEQVRLGKAEVIPTDKTYKIYVNLIQEDGSKKNHKCYFYDFTKAQMVEFVRLYNLNVTDKENISRMKLGAPGHFYVLPFFFKSEYSRR